MPDRAKHATHPCPIRPVRVVASRGMMDSMSSMSTPTDIPVRTRRWCTALMVPIASFMNLLQVAYAANDATQSSPWFVWLTLCTLLAIPSGLVLLARNEHPVGTFWTACALSVLLPFGSTMTLMALSALIARRSDQRTIGWAMAAGTGTAVACQLTDALRAPDASIWQLVFAKPGTGPSYDVPVETMVTQPVLVAVTIAAGVAMSVAAMFIGFYIRQRAVAHLAHEQATAAESHMTTLRQDLDARTFADAVAAEAHDTLAHSLSLLALNASALQAGVHRLATQMEDSPEAADWLPQMRQLSVSAQDIRRQAAGALDEAHMVIDTLRHPDAHRELFEPTDGTALTREALDALVGDVRAAGMQLNTWIDVRSLGSLDEGVGKLAYRVVQEGLTNARRHAPGAPVSLQVDAGPAAGIHIHVSNPTGAPASTASMPARAPTATASGRETAPAGRPAGRSGTGLAGLAERVRQCGGQCRYGFDAHRVFHLDVMLSWSPQTERTAADEA